tara:strand:- start:2809 stop:4107 length:1299 start_codon:yes stop_codon:yes gene_type:complete
MSNHHAPVQHELKTADTLMQLLQKDPSGAYDAIWSWIFCAPPVASSLSEKQLRALSELQRSWSAAAMRDTGQSSDGFLVEHLYGPTPKTSPTTVPPPFSMTTFPEVCEVQMSLLKANISAIQHQSEFQQRLQQTPDLFRLSSWGLEIRLHESEETDWAFNLGPLFRDHMPLCTAFTAEDRLEQQKWQAKYAPLDSPDSIMLPCWIEIDAKDISYQGPQENLFFKIHPKATPDDIKNSLNTLYPQHHWEKAWPPIETFANHLPVAADFFQLGVMQRRDHILKAVAFNFAIEHMLGFLDALQWQGNKSLLVDVIDTLKKYPELKIALSLDFDFSVRDSVGLEIHYFPSESRNLFHEPRQFQQLVQDQFSSLMRFLAEPLFKDVITAEKRLALEQYPKILVGRPFYTYACTLNHVKLSVGEQLKAKAYLYQELRL